MKDELFIWWTTTFDCAAIGGALPPVFPRYLRDEYRSRVGRNGRGRIWVSAELGAAFEATPHGWPDSPLTRFLQEYAAGIVLRASDVPEFADMPGLVTNVRMYRTHLTLKTCQQEGGVSDET